jgi:uncharacterized membrane protein
VPASEFVTPSAHSTLDTSDIGTTIQSHYVYTPLWDGAERMTRTPLLLKTYLMIGIMIVAGPFGNVLLAKGMRQSGRLSAWPLSTALQTLMKVFASGWIWCGVASLIVFFVAYMLVLSWADYSFVQPASSLAYGVVALLGYLVLGERIVPLRWVGIAVICLGVFVVGRTAPNSTAPAVPPQSGGL